MRSNKIITTALLLGMTSLLQAGEIDFNRDIRPILSDNCFYCHGPDNDHRKAGLRLDTRDGAFAKLKGGGHALVAGEPGSSELIARVTSSDPDDLMPPPDSGKSLEPAQIEALKQWVKEGAVYEGHWAFSQPVKHPLPKVQSDAWPRNAIDYFILDRLEKEGLSPSSPASRETLIRRLTFDLTGLPPSLREIDDFLADKAPGAYERLVDRLLNSEHFGEHQARYWLDLVRYGDTHGLHLDNYREMWPYRDWVIRAFNQGMPFDQFTIEQLAGDLFPDPSRDQLIASGYNRCNVTTSEGGSIAEEVYVRNVVDRVQTTGQVFMGLTMGCAVCHDHKFDPITMKDFYSVFAYFNSMDGNPLDGNRRDHRPYIKVPSEQQSSELAMLENRIPELHGEIVKAAMADKADFKAWLESVEPPARPAKVEWQFLTPTDATSDSGTTLTIQEDQSVLASGENPAKDNHTFLFQPGARIFHALRLEALTHDTHSRKSVGRSENGNAVLSGITIERATAEKPEEFVAIPIQSIKGDHEQSKEFVASNAIDGKPDTGWAVEGHSRIENRKATLSLKEPLVLKKGDVLRITTSYQTKYGKHAFGRVRFSGTEQPAPTDMKFQVALGEWFHVGSFTSTSNGQRSFRSRLGPEGKAVDLKKTYDSNGEQRKWEQRLDWRDGEIHMDLPDRECVNYLYRNIHANRAGKLEVSLGSDDGIKVLLNQKEILGENVERDIAPDQHKLTLNLKAGDNELLIKVINTQGKSGFYFKALDPVLPPFDVVQLADKPEKELTPKEQSRLQEIFAHHYASGDQLNGLRESMRAARMELAGLSRAIPTTLIFKETSEPKEAFILVRGEYDKKGEKVTRRTPEALPPMPEGLPNDRMGFAKWLVSSEHPLTARVAVNRFWQSIFGVGIVKTSEDFGNQGELPVHPELLDHLSVDFQENGWNVKRLIKQMVMSSTYRQASTITTALLARDPENRLLARGPRFRLDAEMIRDQALSLSGLLVNQIGGPSVRPPQPDGLWFSVGYSGSNTVRFRPDEGADIYRRSVFTFWKRTSPPPQMTTFDAPSREECSARRERTNTPLQALVLMNEPQFVEASQNFALRAIEAAGGKPEDIATWLYRSATAKVPADADLKDLIGLFRSQQKDFAQSTEDARELISSIATQLPKGASAADMAAWTVVANVILNLDETINKG